MTVCNDDNDKPPLFSSLSRAQERHFSYFHIQPNSLAHSGRELEVYIKPGVCRSFRSLSMWFLANMQYVTNKCKQKWLHHNSRVITRKMELFHLPCHFGAKFCTYIRINILYANLSFYIHLHAHPRPHTCTCTCTFITPCGLYRAYDKDIEWNDVCVCAHSFFVFRVKISATFSHYTANEWLWMWIWIWVCACKKNYGKNEHVVQIIPWTMKCSCVYGLTC